MEIDELKKRLREYKKSDIIIAEHAELQAFVRNVSLEEVKENVVNPTRLVYAKKQEAKYKGEEKYDCYFSYSKHLYHRYVIVLDGKLIIATIISINRDWQKAIG